MFYIEYLIGENEWVRVLLILADLGSKPLMNG